MSLPTPDPAHTRPLEPEQIEDVLAIVLAGPRPDRTTPPGRRR